MTGSLFYVDVMYVNSKLKDSADDKDDHRYSVVKNEAAAYELGVVTIKVWKWL